MARSADPMTYATVVGYVYFFGIPFGVLRPDDRAVNTIEDALRIAERSGDDFALAVTQQTLGFALVHRSAPERDRAQNSQRRSAKRSCARDAFSASYRSSTCTWRGRGLAVAIAMRRYRPCVPPPTICSARDGCWRGEFLRRRSVETLLDRGTESDVAEAEAAIERLATAPDDEGLVTREIWLLRLRALLARAQGDEAYKQLRDRYRAMATLLGVRGAHQVGRGYAMTADEAALLEETATAIRETASQATRVSGDRAGCADVRGRPCLL